MRNCVAKRPRRLLNSTCWWNGWGRVEMADVSLFIGGRQYVVTCRDGDEVRLEFLAAMIDAKVQDAKRAIPGINEVRQLLFAALFLADELNDVKATAESAKTPAPAPPTSDPRLARSEEHTSELQSLMRTSYAVFCLKKTNN